MKGEFYLVEDGRGSYNYGEMEGEVIIIGRQMEKL
jgi:hypothetical protein